MATEPYFGGLSVHPESAAVGSVMFGALLFTFRWFLTLAGGRQDKRIAALEAARENDNRRMMALAHALSEVMAVLDRHETSDPALKAARADALHRARIALLAVFAVPGMAPETMEAGE